MKKIIENLNKAFDNRVRLGIMSVLMVEDWVDFSTLKETLDLTDGNLASHLTALEKEHYIEFRKQFVGRKPQTSYQTTVDTEGNLLIVRASEEVHRQVAKLIANLDTAVDTTESPIQFYKLKNASALDVLYSLLALQEAYGTGGFNGAPAAFYSPFGGSGPGFGIRSA